MNILLIEDEEMIAKRLQRMLRKLLGDTIGSMAWRNGLGSGLTFIQNTPPDLLFLDLNLNGEDGFEVLEMVAAAPFHTIIVSAYRDQAIRAFEYGVLHFVPKPFTIERLSRALERQKSTPTPAQDTKYLAVKKRNSRQLIPVSEVLYIQGAGIYTELNLKDGSTAIHNKTLDQLGNILPIRFARVHKSYLVDMNEALEILVEPGSKYGLRLSNDELIPIGRTRYKSIKERWFTH